MVLAISVRVRGRRAGIHDNDLTARAGLVANSLSSPDLVLPVLSAKLLRESVQLVVPWKRGLGKRIVRDLGAGPHHVIRSRLAELLPATLVGRVDPMLAGSRVLRWRELRRRHALRALGARALP